MEIYPLHKYPGTPKVYPDSTVLTGVDARAARLVQVNRTDVLLPEAANDFDANVALNTVLKEIQQESENPGFKPELSSVREFGIQPGAEEIIERILGTYVEVCRTMAASGLRFAPGTQYAFQGLTEDGIAVSHGNYGLMHATLDASSRDSDYRKALVEAGQNILGTSSGFIHNVPGTSTVVHAGDRVLFVQRGPTAQYPYMLHHVASGHHPTSREPVIELDALILKQIELETGVKPEDVSSIRFNGIAFSSGSELPGTEKVEILTSARINKTDEEVFETIQRDAAHRWETRRLLSIPDANVKELIEKTGGSRDGLADLNGLKSFGAGEQRALGTDPNSYSHWIPVGLAALRTQTLRTL